MTHRYDGLNRLIETLEPPWREPQGEPRRRRRPRSPASSTIPNGNLAEERRFNEPEDQVRSFEYDERNRLKIRRDAFEEPTVFEYDDAGNLEREIDPPPKRHRTIRTTSGIGEGVPPRSTSSQVTDPEPLGDHGF